MSFTVVSFFPATLFYAEIVTTALAKKYVTARTRSTVFKKTVAALFLVKRMRSTSAPAPGVSHADDRRPLLGASITYI